MLPNKGWRLASFGGSSILLEWADRAAGLGVQYLLESHPIPKLSLPISTTYRLHSNRINSGLTVFEGASCLYSGPDYASGLSSLIESMMQTWTINCSGGLVLHAALMSKQGMGILIGGASGAGKSSLAAWLMQQGWAYHGDEQVYADAVNEHLEGFARPICLKEGWTQTFPEVISQTDLVTKVRGQTLVPAKLFGQISAPVQAVKAQLLVFPKFQAESDLSIERLSPAQAAINLVHLTINHQNLGNRGIGQAAKIARNCPAYHLSYGNFDQLSPFLDLIDHAVYDA